MLLTETTALFKPSIELEILYQRVLVVVESISVDVVLKVTAARRASTYGANVCNDNTVALENVSTTVSNNLLLASNLLMILVRLT